MSTQPHPGEAARKETRGRKPIPMSLKLEMIAKYENGVKLRDIAKETGKATSTIRVVVKDREGIKEAARRSRARPEMERRLARWMHGTQKQQQELSFTDIQVKALSLYRDIERRSGTRHGSLKANRAWLRQFKKSLPTYRSKFKGEAFQQKLTEIIEREAYLPEQIFNVDETDLFWRQMPAEMDLSEDEMCLPGSLVGEDRILLMFGGNASGDLKLKPLVVYHSDRPGTVTDQTCENSVIWRTNRKVLMTSTICTDWYVNHFIPSVGDYCKEKGIPFKILLIMTSAGGHPHSLDYFHPHVKVLYFPPQTARVIQPVSHGIRQMFRALYYQHSYEQALKAKQSEGGTTLRDFWKSYNILDCMDHVTTAWEKVTSKCMNVAWHKLCPQFVSDFGGLTEIEEAERKCREIVDAVEFATKKENFEKLPETCTEEKLPEKNDKAEEEEGAKHGEQTSESSRLPQERLQKWIIALKLPQRSPIQRPQLCSTHFTDEGLDRTGETVQLRNPAVPTLFAFSGDHQNKSDNYMDEDTNSASHDQDGSFDEISIKEENDMDDFSVFVNEEDQKGKEKEQEEELDPLGEFQCPQEDGNSNQDLNTTSGKRAWNHEETMKLLEIYKSKLPQIKSGTILTSTLWQEIEKEMQACGYPYDRKACSKKVKRLKVSYRVIQKNCKKTLKTWKYFEPVDEIFGDSVNLEKAANPADPETEQPSTSATCVLSGTSAESPSTPAPILTPVSERTVSCPPSPVYKTTSPSPSPEPTPVAAQPPTEETGALDPATVPVSSNKRKRTEDPTNVLGEFLSDQASRLEKLVNIAERRNQIMEKCMNQMLQNQQMQLQQVQMLQQQQDILQQQQEQRQRAQERLQEQQKQQYQEMLNLQRQQFLIMRQQLKDIKEVSQ
ncbi:uncharacterized protein LOC119573369 isoform X2 [Penaeus monodon]|uniref:uncharacterized protein LOC119573369 isoform X2 n=1 Tax=Penaeus monodon TaxID=6687 RepID=UPI0018A77945|nr:uncharacterized protein LOC119573369 isoform X2 [Penaeus monodon]